MKGSQIPGSLGAQADLYADVRDLRLSMQKATDAVKERETEIYNGILLVLSESTDTGAAGEHHRVQMVSKVRRHVTDWPSLWEFIRQRGMFELLQKRLSETAVDEFTATTGQVIPGVESVDVPSLSFNKI